MDVHMCKTFYSLSKTMGGDHEGHKPEIPIDPQYSYSMNFFLGGNASESVKKSTDVRQPSNVLFFTEENLWTIDGLSLYALNNNIFYTRKTDSYDCLATYHQYNGGDMNTGHANIVFVDGSVGMGDAKDSYRLCLPKSKVY